MVNVTSLIKLADSEFSKELSEYQQLPSGIKEALQEQLAEDQKNRAKAAAREIVELLKLHETSVERGVRQIRSYRSEIDSQKAHLTRINRAREYGMETSNFLPLAIALNQVRHHELTGVDSKLFEVPSSWEPKAKESETAE